MKTKDKKMYIKIYSFQNSNSVTLFDIVICKSRDYDIRSELPDIAYDAFLFNSPNNYVRRLSCLPKALNFHNDYRFEVQELITCLKHNFLLTFKELIVEIKKLFPDAKLTITKIKK